MHPVIRQREVAHIIARQLTLLWCDDALLWSKEGFAAFFGAYILDQVVFYFCNCCILCIFICYNKQV